MHIYLYIHVYTYIYICVYVCIYSLSLAQSDAGCLVKLLQVLELF